MLPTVAMSLTGKPQIRELGPSHQQQEKVIKKIVKHVKPQMWQNEKKL
jgi:hypothetical protein